MDNIKNEILKFIHIQTKAFNSDPETYIIKILLPILAGLAIFFALRCLGLLWELVKSRRIEKRGVLLEVLVKESTSSKATEALIRNIHSLLLNTKIREFVYGRPYLSFEIGAKKDEITFYIWVPRDFKNVMVERIYATYPECAIRETEDYLGRLHRKQKVYLTEMELSFHHILSLNKSLESEDIIGSVLSGMKNMEWHEQASVQILIKPIDGKWQTKGQKILRDYVMTGIRPNKNGSKSTWGRKLADEMEQMVYGGLSEIKLANKVKHTVLVSRKTPYERKELTGASDKIMDCGFEVIIRLAAIGNYRKTAKTRLKIISAAFNELDKENKLHRKVIFRKNYYFNRLRRRRHFLLNRSNILSPGELSKFFLRVPDADMLDVVPEVKALIVKEFAPPRDMEREKFLIGKNFYRGIETFVGLKPKDLVRHMIVQGKTGTGKSEWAKGVMTDVAKQGMGFALFEPHGKLAVETLQLIPEERIKDVIVFDLSDDYPPPFNFCKVKEIPGRKMDEVIEKTAKEIIDINRRLFSEAWSGKNAYFLENAIKTVIELKGGNYVDIRRLFSDAAFRTYAIENIKDPQLKHFWREEFKLDAKGNIPVATQSTVNSVDYKLGTFLNSKSLLRSVGQDDCIDFKEILDQNKILIFRFDKERMSEDQIAFIGGIAIKLLIVEAFRRNKARWNDPYLVVIDEAQNFIDPSLKTVLYELRKYGVGLVMMHQALEQMEYVKGLTDAIYGNVGTMISFTTGKPDAPFFGKLFEPRIDEADMTRLPSRYGYCKLMVDGKTSEAFNIYTLDSPEVERNEGIKKHKRIIELNRTGRLHYMEIDKMISKRLTGSIEEAYDDSESEYEFDDDGAEEWGIDEAAVAEPQPQAELEDGVNDWFEDWEDEEGEIIE